ncbi:hypothetical protein GUITHDRAFT_149825, partial [Guillardia theta CCMP2712]
MLVLAAFALLCCEGSAAFMASSFIQRLRTSSVRPIQLLRTQMHPHRLSTWRSSSRRAHITSMARTFEFVPYGQKFESDKKSICVDGLVPGTSLQLTHWNGNETPKEYKADLSTDIVLKFIHAELGSEKNKWNDAVVLNNHFDTDGLLSVWIMLNPEAAMKYERRMVDAAAAGDFDEWGLSDWGLQLDLAFSKLASQCDGDKQAYEKLLPMVEDILVNVDDREELWKEELDEMYKIFDMVCDDKIV